MAKDDYSIAGRPVTEYRTEKDAISAFLGSPQIKRQARELQNTGLGDASDEFLASARQQAKQMYSEGMAFEKRRKARLEARKGLTGARTAQVQRRAFFEEDMAPTTGG